MLPSQQSVVQGAYQKLLVALAVQDAASLAANCRPSGVWHAAVVSRRLPREHDSFTTLPDIPRNAPELLETSKLIVARLYGCHEILLALPTPGPLSVYD